MPQFCVAICSPDNKYLPAGTWRKIWSLVAGARYAFEPDDVLRLGADIRAFLSSRREGFVSYSGVV